MLDSLNSAGFSNEYLKQNLIGFCYDGASAMLGRNSGVGKGLQENFPKIVISSSSSSFEGHPLQVRHKQDWSRGFILLLPQTAALPGSDAGSDVIKPVSGFVIQNRQISCSMWCPMYRARC